MAKQNPKDLRTHPRYEKVLLRAMNRCGLPSYTRLSMDRIFSGEVNEEELECCHTGCVPCNGDLKKCAAIVRTKLRHRRWGIF